MTLSRIAIAAALLACAASAQAQSYGFSCVTNNAAASCADGVAHLSMNVRPGADPNSVAFTFTNFSSGSPSSSVTDIYFADSSVLAGAVVTNGSGVQISQVGGASPSNMPGASSLATPFVTTSGFAIDFSSGSTAAGIENLSVGGTQEFVTINFALKSGKTYADMLGALDGPLGDGNDLRVGLYVRGFAMPYGSTLSESFVNASAVPEPGGTWALSLVAACAVVMRRQIKPRA
jgi:hypothetical protein